MRAVCNAISGGTPEQVRFQLMLVSLYVYVHTVHIYMQIIHTVNILVSKGSPTVAKSLTEIF